MVLRYFANCLLVGLSCSFYGIAQVCEFLATCLLLSFRQLGSDSLGFLGGFCWRHLAAQRPAYGGYNFFVELFVPADVHRRYGILFYRESDLSDMM